MFPTLEPVPACSAVSVNCRTNVAWHDFAASIVTFVGFAIPLQATLHPPKTESSLGKASNTTTEPWSKSSMQKAPHVIPGGVETTVPVPLPFFVTLSVCLIRVKVAVQPLASSIVTLVIAAIPLQSSLQSSNVELGPGVAVSVTIVPTEYCSIQSVPGQSSMPAGFEVTVPDPVPLTVTASVLGGITSNVAVQLRAAFIVTLPSVQSAPPLHPPNVEPPSGLGMRVTIVPSSYASVQSAPQVIPAGLVVTVPEPLPVFDTVRMKVTIGLRSNVAVQLRFAFIVTLPLLQSAAPPQPTNVDPVLAVAVSVTAVPSG